MQEQRNQIISKCHEAFAKAKVLYGLDLSAVRISFDLKGRCAGQAYRKKGVYGMRFNNDMLGRDAFDHVLNDTVPHEVAHIVCFMNPRFGHGHNQGWKQVCISLGGSGERLHNEEVVYGEGMTFEYTTTNGAKVRISEQRHKAVQRGRGFVSRDGKGTINQSCIYTIVGIQGRTLPEDRQRTVVPVTKEVSVQSIVSTPPAPVKTRLTVTGTKDEIMKTVFGVSTPTKPQPMIVPTNGASKADVARRLMVEGKRRGMSHEEIVQSIMLANGHPRALAYSYFKNNAARCGIVL